MRQLTKLEGCRVKGAITTKVSSETVGQAVGQVNSRRASRKRTAKLNTVTAIYARRVDHMPVMSFESDTHSMKTTSLVLNENGNGGSGTVKE